MALATLAHIEEVLKKSLEPGEELRAFCYGLLGLKGYAVGVTLKRLLLLRLGMFLGGVKETIVIPLTDVGKIEYEKFWPEIGGVAYMPASAKLTIATTSATYAFRVQSAALDVKGNNFDGAEKVANILKKN